MKKIDVKESKIYRFDSREDLSQAILLLGEKGYFSDSDDFTECEYGTLIEVMGNVQVRSLPFVKRNNNADNYFKYFIAEKTIVFEKEKKIRPYKDICEFSNETNCEEVGKDLLIIRNKKDKQEKVLLYTGYSNTAVHLGAYLITFNSLFSDYEFLYDNEWVDFSIEE